MNIQLRYSILFAWVLTGILFTAGCGGQTATQSDDQQEKMESSEPEVRSTEGPEYTSAYICPMHCEGSGDDEAGVCPVCGMDYIARAEHEGDGHQHGHSHEGHAH